MDQDPGSLDLRHRARPHSCGSYIEARISAAPSRFSESPDTQSGCGNRSLAQKYSKLLQFLQLRKRLLRSVFRDRSAISARLLRPMPNPRPNIALIGMPGAGKSTLGVQLANRTGRTLIDVDVVIRKSEGTPLSEIIEQRGVETFRRIEERCVIGLNCSNCVIATGGSVVYSEPAMEHLGKIALRLYLDVPVAVLAHRLGDLDARAVLRAPQQTLESLYEERRPLYERWADLRVGCGDLGHDGVIDAIVAALEAQN